MKVGTSNGHRMKVGFTLIELLVVVAIIALLISILLPSLGQARAQARSTLCATRLSQLTRSWLLYADDYGEIPPFMGCGFEDISSTNTYQWLDGGAHGEDWWLSQETWIVKEMSVALAQNVDWPRSITPEYSPFYSYTRSPALNKCPEFERIPQGSSGGFNESVKTQNVFNYTRSIMGRKLLSAFVGDVEVGSSQLEPGPIMKVSAWQSPAMAFMGIDEQWDFHCAGNYNGVGVIDMSGCYMAAEPVHGLVFDMFGSYHGVKGRLIPFPEVYDAKKANVSYYDGHVDAYLDPLPWRTANGDLGTLKQKLRDNWQDGLKVLDILFGQLFAQRGIAIPDAAMQLLVNAVFN